MCTSASTSTMFALLICLCLALPITGFMHSTRLRAMNLNKALYSTPSTSTSTPDGATNNYEPISITEDQRKENERQTVKKMARLGFEEGFGGYWPGAPDAKRHKVTVLSGGDAYTLMVPVDRYIYFYFEEQGIELPIVNKARMCRQGCCTICTGKIIDDSIDPSQLRKKVKMDAPLGLLRDFRKEGYALTCCSYPVTDNLVLELQSEDNMYIKQWSEGFEGGGTEWGGFLPDDGD